MLVRGVTSLERRVGDLVTDLLVNLDGRRGSGTSKVSYQACSSDRGEDLRLPHDVVVLRQLLRDDDADERIHDGAGGGRAGHR